MELMINDEATIKEIIKQLTHCSGIVVNVYYQVIGNVTNSVLKNVNSSNCDISSDNERIKQVINNKNYIIYLFHSSCFLYLE